MGTSMLNVFFYVVYCTSLSSVVRVRWWRMAL